MTNTFNLHHPDHIPPLEWELSVKMESHFAGRNMTALECAISMLRCSARFIALNVPDDTSAEDTEKLANELASVFKNALRVEDFRRKSWAKKSPAPPEDHLKAIDELCQQGLNSADGDHWEAALRDIMRYVRDVRGETA